MEVELGNIVVTSAAAALFAAGGAWATVRTSVRSLRNHVTRLEERCEAFEDDIEQARHARNIMHSALGMLAVTVNDPAQRRLIEIALAKSNSPVRLQYGALRQMVARLGRPPEYVIEKIRAIAEDADDDVEVMGYIRLAFTNEQLAMACKDHEITELSDAMELARMFFADARVRGIEACLKDAGLIDHGRV